MAALEPAPSVLFQVVEDELVLLDMQRSRYYSLDAVGCRIWQLFVEHGGVDAVVQEMLVEFDVDERTLRGDIAELFDQLIAKELIVSRHRQ